MVRCPVSANLVPTRISLVRAAGESMRFALHRPGFPDRPLVRTGISIGASIAALWGDWGTDGTAPPEVGRLVTGQVVDVALYEAVFAMMESMVPGVDVFVFVRERTGTLCQVSHPRDAYDTDCKHVMIGANGDAIFKRFMQAIGRNDLADDPGLADNTGRDARREETYRLIDAWCGEHDEAEALATLEKAGVPASRVYAIADMFADPSSLPARCLNADNYRMGSPSRRPGYRTQIIRTPANRMDWARPGGA